MNIYKYILPFTAIISQSHTRVGSKSLRKTELSNWQVYEDFPLIFVGFARYFSTNQTKDMNEDETQKTTKGKNKATIT